MKFNEKQDKCEEHGEFKSANPIGNIWTKCPVCTEKLMKVSEEKRKQEDIAEVAERRKIRLESMFKKSCIPKRFADRTLDSYIPYNDEMANALAMCKSYADNFNRLHKAGTSLLFCGLPGTGKTHLAIGIANQIMKGGKTSLFISVLSAIRKIKDTWGQGAEMKESEVIEWLTSPDLLILDEVGVQHGSETEKNLLFSIINERYESRLPSIIISNLDVDGVKEYLGDRAHDRLREDGGKLISFTWDSYRGKKWNM